MSAPLPLSLPRSFHFPPVQRLVAVLCAAVLVVGCGDDPAAPGDPSFEEPGTLSVHTVASGHWIPDGELQVLVDEDSATVEQLDFNGSASFQVPAGEHVVELFRGGGQPFFPACAVEGGVLREVTIEPGQTSLAEFELFCEVALELSVSTSGTSPDTDGYRLLVGPSWLTDSDFGPFPVYTVPPEGSLSFDHTSPTWWSPFNPPTHVYLWGAALNCTLLEPNPFILDTGGGVTSGELDVECVEFSPATGTIYFLRAPGVDQVFRVEADGTGLVQLTDGPRIREWTLSPDGSEIIFSPWYDGGLFRVGVDGAGLTRITPDDESTDINVDWGADGRVLYAVEGPGGQAAIYSILPDGTDRRLLTQVGAAPDPDPTLSPDGSTIAFEGHDGLTLMDADGSNVRLVPGPIDIESPRWSPDGSRLAGVMRSETTNFEEIVVDDVSTGELTVVGRRPLQSLRDFAWSPAGDRLVYVGRQDSDDWPADDEHHGDLFTVSADGFNLGRLTTIDFRGRDIVWRE